MDKNECKTINNVEFKRNKDLDIQDEKALSELSGLLKYSKKITIVDPHCNLLRNHYKKSFELIIKMLNASAVNHKELVFHVQKPDDERDLYLKRHKEIFSALKYIRLKFNIWDGTLHKRILSTDLGHIQMDDGINIQDKNHDKGAIWTLLSDNTASSVLNRYDTANKNAHIPLYKYEDTSWYKWEETMWNKLRLQ